MNTHECKNIFRREICSEKNATYFKAVAADITWIQRSEKGPGGIREQTKHQAYATAWELAYQEVPAISKGYGEILKSVVSNTEANHLYKELRNRNISEYSDITTPQTIFL